MTQTVLIATDTLPPDPNGVALISLRTAAILADSAEVTLVGPACADIPVAVSHIPMKRSPFGNSDLRLPWPQIGPIHAAVRRAGHVIIQTPGPVGGLALLLAKRLGKPTSLFLHNDYRMIPRYALPRTPLIPVLEWAAAALERWAVAAADRVVASDSKRCQAGVELLTLRPPLFAGPVRHSMRDGCISIAYHGRVSSEKAVDVTVRAIATADGRGKRLRFVVVGAGSLLPSVVSLANGLGVTIEHIPWCSEPRTYISGAEIYVTATREETFSVSTLEALGCGLPVVARAVGSIPRYIRHGVNGILFERDEELAGLITNLAGDANLRRRLGLAAMEASIEESIWHQFAAASIPG